MSNRDSDDTDDTDDGAVDALPILRGRVTVVVGVAVATILLIWISLRGRPTAPGDARRSIGGDPTAPAPAPPPGSAAPKVRELRATAVLPPPPPPPPYAAAAGDAGGPGGVTPQATPATASDSPRRAP